MSCLFAGTGVVLPYLSRWLEVERGLAGAEIGVVLSLSQLARIGVGPMIAVWADSVRDRRTPLRVLAIAACIAYAAFFFLARDFWSLLALGFVALTLTQALTPFVEAGTLRATVEGKLSYGVARGIGSVAFIIANIAGGILIARFGLGAVVVWVLTAFACLGVSVWSGLRPDPAPADAHAGARFGGLGRLLSERRFIILIVACGLIQAAHAYYYGFATLVWRAQGVTPEAIGLLWAFGVAVEVLFLWSLGPIERRISAETLIVLGAAAGVVRWVVLGFAPSGTMLWPLQALHALTFAAVHVGAMRLIFRTAPETSAGLAQTLYAGLSGGLLSGLATLASGLLYDGVGARGYWLMAVMAAAGGALALLLLPQRPASNRLQP